MQQQVKVTGYIDVPDSWEFPDIDQRLVLDEVMVEIKGEKTMRAKTSGEASTKKHTLETVILTGASIAEVLPAAPNVDGQMELE